MGLPIPRQFQLQNEQMELVQKAIAYEQASLAKIKTDIQGPLGKDS